MPRLPVSPFHIDPADVAPDDLPVWLFARNTFALSLVLCVAALMCLALLFQHHDTSTENLLLTLSFTNALYSILCSFIFLATLRELGQNRPDPPPPRPYKPPPSPRGGVAFI